MQNIKNDDWPFLPEFTKDEMRCKGYRYGCACNGILLPTFEFMTWLTELRREAKIPFHVTSGARCYEHNKNVGGAPDSYHVRGVAVDLHTSGEALLHILELALARNVKGVGIAQNNKQRMLHLDIRPGKRAVFTYPLIIK